jgi:CubicO group peptidase (beta-lactamase class C family)
MTATRCSFTLFLAALLACATMLAQQPLPAPLQGGPPSDVPVAIQVLRWSMLDSNVNALAFRSMDTLFTTRTVARSGPVWNLRRNDQALDFTYRWRGQDHPAADVLERTYTNALLVMKDGRIISEIYRNNSVASTRFIGWSMTKSITSVLIGCALAEKRIDSLDTPVSRYLPELKGGGYDGVTILQVMQMRSGVDYPERYDFANPGIAASNHIASLVKNVARFVDPARTIARAREPGSFFQYKTLDTAVLGWLVERVSGMSVAAYTEKCLWEPLGAEADGFYIMDGPPGTGREFSGAGFNATLRDYARFGQMVLDGGVADGRRIVTREWISRSTAPSGGNGGTDNGYGLQWWTREGNAFAAIGLQGQYIYINPPTRTVVVKLSYYPPGDNSAEGEAMAFMRAVSDWRPK